MSFGNKLKQILDRKQITVTELADRTGIKRDTLYSIIRRNTKKVNPEIVTKIAAAIDEDPRTLVYDEVSTVEIDPSEVHENHSFENSHAHDDASILFKLRPDELQRVIDFATGLIAGRMP